MRIPSDYLRSVPKITTFEFNISPLWKPWREEFAAKIPRVNDKMNSKIMYKIDDKQKCYRGIRQ
jgi:hypothetical protein